MSEGKRLYRPVGLKELELILDADFKAFPHRLPEQPVFYPVLELDYARKIAREWNVEDDRSGFVGYVTEFDVARSYVDRFEEHVVGGRKHRELWVPADELDDFNKQLLGPIRVREAYYGEHYVGPTPAPTILKGRDPRQQFLTLAHTMDDSGFDFICETGVNWKVIAANVGYWMAADFSPERISGEKKTAVLRAIRKAWASRRDQDLLPQ